jgi:two-component system, cell cycle sensor histidine kinase and response regulator CckA
MTTAHADFRQISPRSDHSDPVQDPLPDRIGKLTVAVILLIATAFGCLVVYRNQETAMRQHVEGDLASVALFKARQLRLWRGERLADAKHMLAQFALSEALRSPGPVEDLPRGPAMLRQLQAIRDLYGYADVAITHPDGSLRYSVSGNRWLCPQIPAAMADAAERRDVVEIPLHRDHENAEIHFSILCPLFAEDGSLVAGVIFISDLRKSIFPILSEWPGNRLSARVLLMQKTADRILHLNAGRPEESFPLEPDARLADLPIYQAVRGKRGFLQGGSSSAREMVGYATGVEGTNWVLIAQMKSSEAYHSWYQQTALILVVVMALASAIAFALFWLLQRVRFSHASERLRNAEELHQNKEFLDQLIEHANAPIIVWDPAFRIIRFNHAFENLTGLRADQVIGRPLDILFPPENVDDSMARIRETGIGNRWVSMEIPIRHIQGTVSTVLWNSATIRAQDGKSPLATIAQGQDISAYKKAHAALEASERRFNRFMHETPVHAYIKNANLRMIYQNQRVRELAEKGLVDLENNTHPMMDAASGQAVQQADLRILRGESLREELHYPVTIDGRTHWLHDIKFALPGPDGRREVAGLAIDITSRMRAEEQSRLLGQAMAQTPEAIFITDAAGVIQYANPAFCRMTGWRSDEVAGAKPSLLKSGKHSRDFYRQMWETISAGKSWEGRIVNRRKDGSLVAVRSLIAPILDDMGKITHYVSSEYDLTETERLSGQLQQAQKMESVGRLAGGVAHDFNNLITGIMGHAELAMVGLPQDHPAVPDLDAILEGAERSARLTRQLLTFARKQVFEPRTLNLNQAVEGMTRMLQRLIGEDITLDWQPASELWEIWIDPSQVDQILANLCVNARDAIEGTGRISISTENRRITPPEAQGEPDLKAGDYVVISVRDTGCGMSEEIIEQIFEPFFTTKEAERGTGLGLATVYGIIQQNHGAIRVESKPGAGSTFRLFLPRHLPESHPDPSADQTGATNAAVVAPKTRLSILFVEDDEDVRSLVRRMLEQEGHRVLAAEHPAAALQAAADASLAFDLLLSDIIMPDLSGRDLARQLKQTRPGLRVLFLSGYTGERLEQGGHAEEREQLLSKPFSREALFEKIRQVMQS